MNYRELYTNDAFSKHQWYQKKDCEEGMKNEMDAAMVYVDKYCKAATTKIHDEGFLPQMMQFGESTIEYLIGRVRLILQEMNSHCLICT